MAKKTKWDKTHDAHLKKIGQKIYELYDKAVIESANIATLIKNYNPNKPFYVKDYPQTAMKIEQVMKHLHDNVTTVIEKGTRLEWDLANEKNDELVNRLLGPYGDAVPEEVLKRFMKNNEEAREAFIRRKTEVRGEVEGLNLSDKVWRYTDQFKEEIELGLDIGLGEGKSADQLSRDLRQYLREPNKLFRRVRDKHGVLRLSKAAKAYHPSRGVYRSSYKNARRLAATETNIAYRTSDHMRWNQLDFVVGIRINLSKNHTLNGQPFTDICDDLQGLYPKGFKFTGWHPLCRCYATSVLKTEDELFRDLDGVDRGSKNAVTKMPSAFTDYVDKHREQIEGWKSKPYWVLDNYKDGDFSKGLSVFGRNEFTKKGKQKFKTEEQKEAIRKAWLNRAKNNGGKLIKSIESEGFDEMGVSLSSLESAIKNNDTAAIRNAMASTKDKLAQRRIAIKSEAKEAILKAKDWREIDTTALEDLIGGDDYRKIFKATESLTSKVQTMEYWADDIEKVIPNIREWHKTFSIDELDKTKAGVERTLGHMPVELRARKDKLEFEIRWVENNKRYPTWEVAQSAYKKELKRVVYDIDKIDVTESVREALAVAKTSRSKDLRALADDMKRILATDGFDIKDARVKADALNKKKDEILAKRKGAVKSAKVAPTTGVGRETLDDLKARLGNDLPETLPYLDDAIKKYEKTQKYGVIAKQHKDEIEELMLKVFDEHDFGMNIDEDVIDKVLTSWFKNTFETGGGNGYVGSRKTTGKIEVEHDRLSAAHKLFGLPNGDLLNDQLKRSAYEKYGNLLDHNILDSLRNNTARQYGAVEVRFKKDKVITTWTAGDSLGLQFQPSLCSDPKSCSFDAMSRTPTSASTQYKDLAQFKRNHISSYLELQYHGDLTVDCVESLAFPYDLLKRPNELATANKWKNKGVKIYFIGDDGSLKQL